MLISIRNLYEVRQRVYHIQECICTHIHSFPVIVNYKAKAKAKVKAKAKTVQIPQKSHRNLCLRINATKSRQCTHIKKAKKIYIGVHAAHRSKRKQGLNCTLHQKNLVYIKTKQTYFHSQMSPINGTVPDLQRNAQFSADLEEKTAHTQKLKLVNMHTWKYFLGFLKNRHYKHYIWNAILKSILHGMYSGFDRSFGIHRAKPNLHAIKFLGARANCPRGHAVYCTPVGATARRLVHKVGPFVPIWVYFEKYKDYINLSEFVCQIRQNLTAWPFQSLGDVIQTGSISSHFVPEGHISDFRQLVYAERIARDKRSLSGLGLTQKEGPPSARRAHSSERHKSSYKIDCVRIETSTTAKSQENVSLEMHLGSLRDPRYFDWQSDLLSSQSVCTHIQTRACTRFPSWNKQQQPKGLGFWKRTSFRSQKCEVDDGSEIGPKGNLHNGPSVPILGKSYVEKGFGRKNHGFGYEGFILASLQGIFFSLRDNHHSTFLSLASSQLKSPFSYIWSKDPRLVRKSLRTFCFRSEPVVNMIIKQHYSKAHNASLLVQNLSRFVIAFLKRNKGSKNKLQQLKNIAYKILLSLAHQNRCLGVGFSFSGRVYGARKASSLKMLFGSVPFNTLEANMDYSKIMQKTRNGTWGFQTWLHLKQKKHINFLAHSQCEREYPLTNV